MAESIITHYCLGTGELKCLGCRQEKNWQLLNQLPDELRKKVQDQARRIDTEDCILMGRPWKNDGLIKAWDSFIGPSDDLDIKTPHPMFSAVFNAGWDALLAEIRPLVADLKLASEYDHRDSIGQQVSDRLKHADAVERLRERVRESSEK